MGDNSGTLKYMNLAADDYAESGSSDLSAMALQKAAKCLEDVEPEDAIKVFSFCFLKYEKINCALQGIFVCLILKILEFITLLFYFKLIQFFLLILR